MSAHLATAAHRIRRVEPADRPALLALWERSVRATHFFLPEEDLEFYRPLVAVFLEGASCELWILADDDGAPMGFLGLSEHAIEALFLDPAHLRQGWGRRLVAYAQDVKGGALTVDVNEQNIGACRFYAAVGFLSVGRSPVDEVQRPYPLIHLRREAPEG